MALAVLGDWLDSMVFEVLPNFNDPIPAADSELLQLTEQILWKHQPCSLQLQSTHSTASPSPTWLLCFTHPPKPAAGTHTKWAKMVSPMRPDRIRCFLVMS